MYIFQKALAEDFAVLLYCPSPLRSDYLIASRCVGLVAEFAAAAARHLDEVLHTISFPNRGGPTVSHLTNTVIQNGGFLATEKDTSNKG